MENTNIDEPIILKIHKNHIEDVEFQTRLAGSTFYDNAQELLKALKNSSVTQAIRLNFVCEPNNPEDKYAVQIYLSLLNYSQTYLIGHVPKDCSHLIFYVLKHPNLYDLSVYNIRILGCTPDKENAGLFFNFKITPIPQYTNRG